MILLWFGLYYIVSLSLNMEFGYAGIPNFGKALSVLVGAIAVGGILNRLLILYFGVGGDFITGSTYATSMINDLIASNPVVGIGILILAIILASILGFIVGAIFILPSAKLKEDYLGITLLAISEAVLLVCTYDLNIIGGYYGISTPDILAFVSGEYRGWVFTGIVLFIAFLLVLSYLSPVLAETTSSDPVIDPDPTTESTETQSTTATETESEDVTEPTSLIVTDDANSEVDVTNEVNTNTTEIITPTSTPTTCIRTAQSPPRGSTTGWPWMFSRATDACADRASSANPRATSSGCTRASKPDAAP